MGAVPHSGGDNVGDPIGGNKHIIFFIAILKIEVMIVCLSIAI